MKHLIIKKTLHFLNIFQGRLAYACTHVRKDRKAFIKFFFYLSSQGRNVMYMDSANTSVTSTTEDQRPSSRLTRSRSLETSKGRATLRSRSLDCAGDRSSPEADEDEEAVSGQRFVVLADYMALTSREIDLNEDEVVELIKVGCAGWWYVRITTYPYPEGWAPSTYLEKMTT